MDDRGSLCKACPRACDINRNEKTGFCGMGNLPVIAKASLHLWEEPFISGTRGSGTVFFSGCNLRCVYCQNDVISQQKFGKEVNITGLGRIFLSLQQKGAHNINLVSPSHYVPQITKCLETLHGLQIPVVYNSNGYDSQEALKMLEGKVNVYLPDLKYMDKEVSQKYSCAQEYFEVASDAILEMARQVGTATFNEEGLMQKGLVIRHLILPGQSRESMKILSWIKENLPSTIYISLMSQYVPYFRASEYPEINRRITQFEYDRVVNHLYKLGFENGVIQERDSAQEQYIPLFDLQGIEEFC